MILKKIHSPEYTDHLNGVYEDIKWVTEGETMTEVLVDGSVMAGKEETSVRVERALAFLDTLLVLESDCSISVLRSSDQHHSPAGTQDTDEQSREVGE